VGAQAPVPLFSPEEGHRGKKLRGNIKAL